MGDPVRDYLRQKQYPSRVSEGGFPFLIDRWEAHIDRIAQDRLGDRDEYLNAMDTRQILAEALAVADEMQRAAVLPRLAESDQLFRSLVLLTDVCAWGAMNAYRHGWTREREWWYWTRPRRTTFWPEHPELAVLERVLDLAQSVTHGETQVTLQSVELYAAAVVTNIALSCRDDRLDALSRRGGKVRFRLRLDVMDDAGTTYENMLPAPWYLRLSAPCGVRASFRPALSRDARRIEVAIPEIDIVEHDGTTTPSDRLLLTLGGPWSFIVTTR